jgi:stress-induced morphogen
MARVIAQALAYLGALQHATAFNLARPAVTGGFRSAHQHQVGLCIVMPNRDIEGSWCCCPMSVHQQLFARSSPTLLIHTSTAVLLSLHWHLACTIDRRGGQPPCRRRRRARCTQPYRPSCRRHCHRSTLMSSMSLTGTLARAQRRTSRCVFDVPQHVKSQVCPPRGFHRSAAHYHTHGAGHAVLQPCVLSCQNVHLPVAAVADVTKLARRSLRSAQVVCVSEAFEGKTLIARHRMVNELLKDELATGVHGACSVLGLRPRFIRADMCI